MGDQDNHRLLSSVHTLILYCTKFLCDKLPVTLALDYSHHVITVEGGMGTQLMKRVCQSRVPHEKVFYHQSVSQCNNHPLSLDFGVALSVKCVLLLNPCNKTTHQGIY